MKKLLQVVLCATIYVLLPFGKDVAWSEVLYFDPPQGFYSYTVQKGDTLENLVQNPDHWRITQEVNRVDGRHLLPGFQILLPDPDPNVLKVFTIPMPITIASIARYPRALMICLDQQYFGFYRYGELLFSGPVNTGGIGKETPPGKFFVGEKKRLHISRGPSELTKGAKMYFAIRISNTDKLVHAALLEGVMNSSGCVNVLWHDGERLYAALKHGDPIWIYHEDKAMQSESAQ